MDRFALMQTFVAVAEEQGFAAAARRLGVSPPVVTRAVAALEAHVGGVLLRRTTRKVRLTEAGVRYLDDSRRLLAALAEAEGAVSGAHAEPRGPLGVTAPVMFGRLHVAPILLDFLGRHPGVDARALFVDRVVDLIDEGLDVAVRIARMPDSSLTAVRVGAVRTVLCASPAFLRRHGVPRTPRDLASMPAVAFTHERAAAPWTFHAGARTVSAQPPTPLLVSSAEIALAAARAGVGVTRLLSYQVAADVRARRLRLVLEDFEPPPVPVNVVYREGRRAPARVRAFVDFAVPRLRADPAVNRS